ncbi:MAG: RDD family protein [Gammaproteobacteria bacterium]
MNDDQPAPVSFRRRLAALLYDAIAVTTVVYFAAFVPVFALGESVHGGHNPLFRLYLLAVIFLYFGLSWTRGRTLGMQAWKIEIVDGAGRRPGWRAVVLRFLAAAVSLGAGGLGYFVALADRERRTWPDRWSGTHLVRRASPGA